MELHSWWMTGGRSPTRGFIHRDSSPSPQSQSPRATEKRQPGQPNCQGGAWSWMGQERRAKGETLGCGGVEKATGPAGWVMSDFPLLPTIFESKPQFLQYHLSLCTPQDSSTTLPIQFALIISMFSMTSWPRCWSMACLEALPLFKETATLWILYSEVLPESKGV